MNEVDRWIAELLARQDGVLARRQALSNGMTVGQIRTRLSSGRWSIVQPGVYRSTDHRVSTASRVRAVGLWAGDHSLLSGLAAAWWWGLTDVEPETVDLVTSPQRHLRPRPGTRILRRRLPSADRAWLKAAPVTGLALSTLTGAVALGTNGPALLDRALQTRVTLSELRLAHYRNLGMYGSACAGQLLRAAADGSAAESERRFVALLKSAGIRGWRVNYRWNPTNNRTTVDIAFVTERLAIEIDGWAWHHSPDRFQRDRAKQNQLVGAGWTVLRFTWFDLTNRPDDVIRQVRAALAAAHSAR
jgi:very-short-patch-repair endonuclease